MSDMTLICRNATTFAKMAASTSAFRQFLQRFVRVRTSASISAAAARAKAMRSTIAECKRVYEIAVDACKGKILVNANIRISTRRA